MRRGLLAAGLAILGTFAAVTAVLVTARGDRRTSSEDATRAAVPPIVPGMPYVVDVDRDQADLDLEFQPNSRYSLVISSLARGTESFHVTASARPIATANRLPRRLPAVQPLKSVAESQLVPTSSGSNNSVLAGASSAKRIPEPLPAATALGKTVTSAPRVFALHVTDGSLDDPTQYAKVAAQQVAVGRNVRLYLDNQQSIQELPPGLVSSIAELFDDELIPRFRTVFGTYRDVDGDGRFSVLLSPWLARLQGGRTSIGGFVRGSDFQASISPPFSNRCDMMYVNSQTIPGPHLRTLLIHEYTHAVSFSRRTGADPSHAAYPEEEDWLNEALAHCAESLFDGGWTNLDYRISRYLNDTGAYPLVVEDYYRARLWRCHGCRGATYLFLRYCVERFGTQMLTRLITTPARGTRNIELATGCSFERLFRDWTLSLLDDAASVAEGKTAADANSSQSGEKLASLDLYGSVGPWGLAGPKPRHWVVDSGPVTVDLKGTSTVFLVAAAFPNGGARRIHLSGTRGMQLQVSLVPLSHDRPEIEVEASWSHRASVNQSAAAVRARRTLGDVIRAVVHVMHGENVTIEQIAAEQNSGEERIPLRASGDELKAIEIARNHPPAPPVAASDRTTQKQSNDRVFELPAESFSSATCPVIVKVVAVDAHGRRTAGWATVRERSPQVAGISATQR
jgi:hypothetical protein